MSAEDKGIRTPVRQAEDASLEPVRSWPHEAVAAGHLTYAELIVEVGGDVRTERNDRYVLSEWLAFHELSMDSPVGPEFELRYFERKLTQFTNEVSQAKAKKTAQNLSSRLRVLQKEADRIRFGRGLPATLSGAIQAVLKSQGLSFNWLGSTKTEALNLIEWAKGKSSPRKTEKNELALKGLEVRLGLPDGVLASRAWPNTHGRVANLSDDVPYRRYLAFVLPHAYGLQYRHMPEALQRTLDQLVEHKRQAEHLLPSGEIAVVERAHTWNSDATVKMRVDAVQRFFGFLTLPRLPAASKGLRWDEQIRFGLGYAKEQLRLTLLVDSKVVFDYMKFSELRTFDLQHFLHFEAVVEAQRLGLPPPPNVNIAKTLPGSFETFLALCSSLVNKPTSFLRLHPEFGAELNPPVPEDKWESWCLERHKQLCKLIEISQQRIVHNKRSNKAVLADVLRMEDPRAPFLQMVEAMKSDFPPATQPVWQARRWRDITLMSLLNFECLRIKNVCWLDIGKHLVEKEGRLWLDIPKHEMKNDVWGHAEDIRRQLPADLEEVVRTWMTVYRPLFKGHDKTRALFLSAQTNSVKKPGVDPYRIKELALSRVVADNTKKYLGVSVRAHALRNVNATSVVRQGGTIAQVKAVLNDSPQTATKVYLDVKNSDENRALDDLYLKSRQRAGLK